MNDEDFGIEKNDSTLKLLFIGFLCGVLLLYPSYFAWMSFFNPDFKAAYQFEYEEQLQHLKQVECKYYELEVVRVGKTSHSALRCADSLLEDRYNIEIIKDTSISDERTKYFNEIVRSIEEIEN